ncbi:hypothetical protein D3C73_1276910 [compost metagenome]
MKGVDVGVHRDARAPVEAADADGFDLGGWYLAAADAGRDRFVDSVQPHLRPLLRPQWARLLDLIADAGLGQHSTLG